jgi:DNA-binding response OmpR family regulator
MLLLPALPTNILLIEEDPYYSKLLEDIFKKKDTKWNPTFNHIENGENALNFLLGGPYNVELPDLIILDIDMNKHNGFDILKSLKENLVLNEIPVIIFSLSDSGVQLAKYILAGADNFIIKPTDYKRIIPLIQTAWCDKPRSNVHPFRMQKVQEITYVASRPRWGSDIDLDQIKQDEVFDI